MNLCSERGLRNAAFSILFAAVPVALVGCDEPTASDTAISASFADGAQADLSGTWVFNPEESDRPGDRVGRRFQHAGRRGMRRRAPGDGEGFEGEGGGGPRPRRRVGMRAPRQFEITQDETSVTFSVGEGRSRTLQTNGETVKRELGQRLEIEIRAFWEDGTLVVERKTNRGGTFTQSYSLPENGDQLYLVTTIEHDRLEESIEVQRVYDRG